MVNFAPVLAINLLQELATITIGMNHIDFFLPFSLLDQLIHTFVAQIVKTDHYPDLGSQSPEAVNLIGLQQHLPVRFTAGTTLTALIKKGVQMLRGELKITG